MIHLFLFVLSRSSDMKLYLLVLEVQQKYEIKLKMHLKYLLILLPIAQHATHSICTGMWQSQSSCWKHLIPLIPSYQHTELYEKIHIFLCRSSDRKSYLLALEIQQKYEIKLKMHLKYLLNVRPHTQPKKGGKFALFLVDFFFFQLGYLAER